MTRKARIDKKLHKTWLDLGIIDASQYSYWRKLLFESNEYDVFEISTDHCNGLDSDTVAAINKYNLRFKVSKVPSHEAEDWLSQGGSVIFKFWATDYPSVVMFTGNNPDVI